MSSLGLQPSIHGAQNGMMYTTKYISSVNGTQNSRQHGETEKTDVGVVMY